MKIQGKLYIRKSRNNSFVPEIGINLNKIIELGQKNLNSLKKMHGKQLKLKIISVIEEKTRRVKNARNNNKDR